MSPVLIVAALLLALALVYALCHLPHEGSDDL